MSQDTLTLSMMKSSVERQITYEAPTAIFDIIVGQMQIAQNAKNRIDEEGIVVRNIGGSVIPHPAIKIQNDAEKIIAQLVGKYAAD